MTGGIELSATGLDRRSGIERRTTTFAAFWHGARNPRRRAGRRATDHRAVVDWHSPRLLIPALAILGLCMLDAVLTVMLMRHGAVELNPVMAWFLPQNLMGFALSKLA